MRRLTRLPLRPLVRLRVAGAVAGIAGPAVFTGAWILASLRQAGHSIAAVQISGLAAENARDPEIMIAGFVVLGGCSGLFGEALHRALGGWPRAGLGPRLIQGAGLLAIAAGLLRRDQLMLTAPAGESWHNHAHDLVSAVIYAALIAAPLLQRVAITLPLALLAAVAVRLLAVT